MRHKVKLSHFDYRLPEELITQYPTTFRDQSRMVVLYRTDGSIEHKNFVDILDHFGGKGTFVFNGTKVFPARLYGLKEKNQAKIGVFLLHELDESLRLWDVLVGPARKIRIGNKLEFGEEDGAPMLVAEVIDNTIPRGRILCFLYGGSHKDFLKDLYSLGEAPLPQEIKRPAEPSGLECYQSVFAKHIGAVRALTASLHFSDIILHRLRLQGCNLALLTLHHNLSSYQEIEVEAISKYKVENEEMHIPLECYDIVNQARDDNAQIAAVGATVMRTLEMGVSTDGYFKEFSGWTNEFIYPPYHIHLPTAMLTNFNAPKSIDLMCAATMGREKNVMNAMSVAVKEKYRSSCYGDALLIMD